MEIFINNLLEAYAIQLLQMEEVSLCGFSRI